MNIQSQTYQRLYMALLKIIEPGESFNCALNWCEDYIDKELAFDPVFDNPEQAIRDSLAAYRRGKRK